MDYPRHSGTEDRDFYESAEREAKERKVGLWRDTNAVPPWERRRRRPTQLRWPDVLHDPSDRPFGWLTSAIPPPIVS
jgi:hypothetical protein